MAKNFDLFMERKISLFFKIFRLTAPAWIFTFLAGALSPGFAQTLDESYSLGTEVPIQVMAVQPDGKVLIGGTFGSAGGVPRSRLARFCADGTLDRGFISGVSGGAVGLLSVNAILVQRDGKILLGGLFTQLIGQTGQRNRIARVFPNGSADSDFNPGADGVVNCFALQSDGKILVGGDFTTLGGQSRNRIARLNEDGTLDGSFNPGANGVVTCIAVQPDGKILVGGSFSNCGGTARASLARLNEDGTLDSVFNPGANGHVLCFAIQPDGKLLVGGRFTILSGGGRQRLGRLNSNGSLDTGFNPSASSDVNSLVLQSDGKIFAGGNFSTIGGATRSRIARLETDGTVDATFDVGAVSGDVNSMVLQQDGHILLGGSFTSIAGTSRRRFARLLNPATTSELSVQGSTQINWARGGTAPDLEQVAFDSWNGTEWVSLGLTQRVIGGWLASGLSLPINGLIRAHGRAGDGSGSTGMIEQFLEIGTPQLPELEVRLNDGEPIGKGLESLEFDLAFGEETTATQTITLKNTGSVALTGLVVKIGSTFIPQFSAKALSSTTLAPGESLTVSVDFVPSREGEFISNIEIFSNDPYNSPFGVFLVGVNSRVAPGFNAPQISSIVNSAVTQLDGRVLIGGSFSTVDGIARPRMARLEADGSLDAAFNPRVDASGLVNSIVALRDGSIFAGGYFRTFGGQPAAALGRLNPDGSPSPPLALYSNGPINVLMALPDGKVIAGGGNFTINDTDFTAFRMNGDGSVDSGFAPLESDYNDGALCLAYQADGKILVGGGGLFLQPRRFNADGTMDSSFNPSFGGTAFAMAVQADGKILVAGNFFPNGQLEYRIIRFQADGSLDESFNISTNNTVRTLAIQADGKILVGGDFFTIAGVSRGGGLARLNMDGSIDLNFIPAASVRCINLEKDGKITVAGGFGFISGRYRSRIARLLNDPAVSDLSVTGGSQIDWLRGGSAPEVIQAEFEIWDGSGWSEAVPASRVAGGWRATGLTLPTGHWIRARGFGASNHGSSGLIEEIFGEGIIGTLPVTNSYSTSATLRGEIIADGGTEVISRGVVYGTSQDLTLTNGVVLVSADESNSFSVNAPGLDEETSYFARAYVTTALGTSYGEAVEFMTAKQIIFEQNLADLTRVIAPGRARLFRFTIDTARSASLTIEEAAGLRAILRRNDGTVIVTAEGSPDIVIKEVLVSGEYVLEIEHLAQTEDPLEFQLAIDASVEAMTRPDLAVGANATNWIGRGVYPPARQFLSIPSKKARPLLAHLRIVNDGQLPDVMALQGGRGNSVFGVSYLGAGGNITAGLTTGLYRTSELSEGDGEEQIRIAITPNKKKLIYKRGKKVLVRKARITISVSASSSYDSQISDGGSIEVQQR